MIAIVDYGMGNLRSVSKALSYIGEESVITDSSSVISDSTALILPGVGAYRPAMEALSSRGLDEAIRDYVSSGKNLLGICLGMQLLLDGSYEGVEEGEDYIPGLGLIPGLVKRFPDNMENLKIPQIGWNKLIDVSGSLLKNDDYVYFVHSYYCDPSEDSSVASWTNYGIKYASALENGNIFGTQFHPEKSGEVGLNILRRFIRGSAR